MFLFRNQVLVLALTLVMEPMHPLGIVISGLMALSMTVAGAALILECSLRLHLVPEGAAVSLFGRTLARYPAERLTVIRWDKDQMNGPRMDRLVLSALSLEELAARRERKLRSSGMLIFLITTLIVLGTKQQRTEFY